MSDRQAKLRERLAKKLYQYTHPEFTYDPALDSHEHYWSGMADAILLLLEQHVSERTAELAEQLRLTNIDQLNTEAELDQAEQRADALREALDKYGRHRGGCGSDWWPDMECRCGLDSALAAAPAAEERRRAERAVIDAAQWYFSTDMHLLTTEDTSES